MARHLRIFLASPGDVANERALALKVIEGLAYDAFLRGKVTLETVAWDKPGGGTPMLATLTPQEAITRGLPKPSECDIMVAVFWSRMGTLLPDDWIKPEALRYLSGTEFEQWDPRYLSGTEWEYFDALQAADAHGRPEVLVYRRTEKLLLDPDETEFDEKRRQWRLVSTFFDAFRNPDGSIRRGSASYDIPTDFEDTLRGDLKNVIKKLLEAPEPPRAPSHGKPTKMEPPLWRGSPFPGLRPFTDVDAPIFFGRGREIDGLLRKLSDPANRLIAVVGASGSGKSSLVWAGLAPRLLGQVVPGDEKSPRIGAIPGGQDWLWVRFTPGQVGDNPFIALANSLSNALTRFGETPRQVAKELEADGATLDKWVERALENQPEWAELLLFIDQFEELFTLVDSPCRGLFLDLLGEAARMPRLRIIITLRADFYPNCLEWLTRRAQLAREQLEKGHYPLMAPGVGQLHEMIARPAERAGLAFEGDLADRILSDAGAEPGALALMAFALAELYEARDADGRLTHNAYAHFNGVSGAIGKRADDAFNALKPAVQASLSEVFRELVEVDERGVATRRRAPLHKLQGSAEAKALVDALTDARLLIAGRGEENDAVVEVAHEALFRSWPRLKDWIEHVGADLRLLDRVKAEAQAWVDAGKDSSHRWTHERLEPVYEMFQRLGLNRDDLDEPLKPFVRPEADRLIEELENRNTSHYRRATIGDRLNQVGDPRQGIGVDAAGTPQILWIKVSPGRVCIEDGAGTEDVTPFFIAKHPLTYRQYRAFLEAEDGYRNPQWWENLVQQESPGEQYRPIDNHPADNISLYDAIAFCRWLSARLGYEVRLPSEYEWQQAATGGDPDNIYPWGAEWSDQCANTTESHLSRTTAVGMYPCGVSNNGADRVFDLAGNVLEWCLNNNHYQNEFTSLGDDGGVLRGGSWLDFPHNARTTCRFIYGPFGRCANFGVRICRSSAAKLSSQ